MAGLPWVHTDARNVQAHTGLRLSLWTTPPLCKGGSIILSILQMTKPRHRVQDWAKRKRGSWDSHPASLDLGPRAVLPAASHPIPCIYSRPIRLPHGNMLLQLLQKHSQCLHVPFWNWLPLKACVNIIHNFQARVIQYHICLLQQMINVDNVNYNLTGWMLKCFSYTPSKNNGEEGLVKKCM